MAAEFKPEPAMHCNVNEYDLISKLCHKLLDSGMYQNTDKFPNIPVVEATMKGDLLIFDGYRVSAKGNSDNTKMRNKYAKIMHDYLKKDLNYAKNICGNEISLILLSGFDSSQAPEPATPPLTREIKEIIKATEQNTIQIVMQPAEGTQKQKQERKTFIVRIFLTEDAEQYTEGCVSSDPRKLFVSNVPKNEARYYQVVIQNSAGSNELASKVKYIYN